MVAFALAVAGVFVALTVGRGQASRSGNTLSFVSNRPNIHELLLLDLSYGLSYPLARYPIAVLRSPAWSPDGRNLAYVIDQDARRQLHFLSLDNGMRRNLTYQYSEDFSPAWSPDGAWLAFVSNRDRQREIYLLDTHCLFQRSDCGEGIRNLTNSPAEEFEPSWSPDSTRIAFVTDRDRQSEIYVMDIASGETRNFTQHRAQDFSPTWSPDGTQIAFVTDRTRNYEVFVMDAEDGSEVRNITRNRAEEWFPVWSPDGAKLAFISDQMGTYEVYVYDMAGGAPRNITRNDANDFLPVWSPDGTQIALVSTRDEHQQVYLTDLDCRGAPEHCSRPITSGRTENSVPVWRP
jgi:TolB protein